MKKRALLLLPLFATLLGGCNLGTIIGGDVTSSTSSTSSHTQTTSTITTIVPPSPGHWSNGDKLFFAQHFFDENILPYAFNLQLYEYGNYCLAEDTSSLTLEKLDQYSTLLINRGYFEYYGSIDCPNNNFFLSKTYRLGLGQIITYEDTETQIEIVVCIGSINGHFALMFTKNYYMVPLDGNNYYMGPDAFEYFQDNSIEYMVRYGVDPNEPEAAPSLRAADIPHFDIVNEYDFQFTCKSYAQPFECGNTMNSDVFECVKFKFLYGDMDLFNLFYSGITNAGFNFYNVYHDENYFEYLSVKDTVLGTWYINFYGKKENNTPTGVMNYEFYFSPFNHDIPLF